MQLLLQCCFLFFVGGGGTGQRGVCIWLGHLWHICCWNKRISQRYVICLYECYTDVYCSTIFTVQYYASMVYAVIMCVSVCLSIIHWYCVKTSKLRITQI